MLPDCHHQLAIHDPGNFSKLNYSLIDISIACDQLTLQAEELGLGTCWLGWFNEKASMKCENIFNDTIPSLYYKTE